MSFFTPINSGFAQNRGFTWAVNMPPTANANQTGPGATPNRARVSPWAAISPTPATPSLSEVDFPALSSAGSPVPSPIRRPRVRTRAQTPVQVESSSPTPSSPCTPLMTARRRLPLSPSSSSTPFVRQRVTSSNDSLSSVALTTPDDELPAAPQYLNQSDFSKSPDLAMRCYPVPYAHRHYNREIDFVPYYPVPAAPELNPMVVELRKPRDTGSDLAPKGSPVGIPAEKPTTTAAVDAKLALDKAYQKTVQRALARFFATEIVTMLMYPGQYRPGVGGADHSKWNAGAVDRASWERMGTPQDWPEQPVVLGPYSHKWRFDEWDLRKEHPHGPYGSPAHALVDATHDMITRMNVTPSIVMIALYLIKGLSLHNGDDEWGFYSCLRVPQNYPNKFTIELGVMVTGLMLAGKLHEDNAYRGNSWSVVSTLPLERIKNLENAALRELHHSIYVQPDLWREHLVSTVAGLATRRDSGWEDPEINNVVQTIVGIMLTEAEGEDRSRISRGDTLLTSNFDHISDTNEAVTFDHIIESMVSQSPSPRPDLCSANSSDFSSNSFDRNEYEGAERFLPTRTRIEELQACVNVQDRVRTWAAAVDPFGDAFEPPAPHFNDPVAPLTLCSTEGTEGPYTSMKTYHTIGPHYRQPFERTTPKGFGPREAWHYFYTCGAHDDPWGPTFLNAWNDRSDTCYLSWSLLGFQCVRLRASLFVMNHRGIPIWKASGDIEYVSTPEQLARYEVEDKRDAEQLEYERRYWEYQQNRDPMRPMSVDDPLYW